MVVLAGWCYYDGYLNPEFIKDHTASDGTPQGWLPLNRKAPPFLIAAAVILAVRFWMIKDKKIVADDKGLNCEKLTIPYDRMDSIDKTHFDSKGYFIVHYRDGQDKTQQVQISDRQYDNMPAVLDHLVSKLTS